MCDVAENRVRPPIQACPPGRADDHKVCRLDSLPAEMEGRHHPEDGGTFRHSTARPPQKPCFGGWSESGFDAAALHAQLADLLQIYLKRASQPDAVEKCSAKDAVNCAKNITQMMTDIQSGRPASVSRDAKWSKTTPRVRPPIQAADHRSRRLDSRRYPLEGPITTLEDAVAIVCNSDEETQILEPWARLLARIEKLCTETQKRLNRVQPPIQACPPGRADDHRSRRLDSLTDEMEGRHHPLDTGGTGACPPELWQRMVAIGGAGGSPVSRRLDTGMEERCGTGSRSTEDSATIKREPTHYSLGEGGSNNQKPISNNRARSAPRAPPAR